MDIKGLMQTGSTLKIERHTFTYRVPPLEMFQCRLLNMFVSRVLRYSECKDGVLTVRIGQDLKVHIFEEGTRPTRQLCCSVNRKPGRRNYRVQGQYTREGVQGREVHSSFRTEEFMFLEQTLEDCQTLGSFEVMFLEGGMELQIKEKVALCKSLTWDWQEEGLSEHDLMLLCTR
jgi:hypothetical protein